MEEDFKRRWHALGEFCGMEGTESSEGGQFDGGEFTECARGYEWWRTRVGADKEFCGDECGV